MQKVTFKKLRSGNDGSQHTHDATVWTYYDPWGVRVFEQKISYDIGMLEEHDMAGVTCLPNASGKTEWYGELDVLQAIIPDDMYEARIGRVTFVGTIMHHGKNFISFHPKGADICAYESATPNRS